MRLPPCAGWLDGLVMMLLFPCDPLRRTRPDPHFSDEYVAARNLGIAVGLIDHDAASAGEFTACCARVPSIGDGAVYRGWMMQPSVYLGFETALARLGVVLRTSHESYVRAHHLPRWFGAVKDDTPYSAWTETDADAELLAAVRRFPSAPVVVKDYSKSEKHYWDEAMYIPDTSDEDHVLRVARRFRELRGAFFDGGFVVRAFERFEGPELRTWWVDGSCVMVTPHPDGPAETSWSDVRSQIDGFGSSISRVGSPFVAVDVVRRADGALRIVEIGDGQVSDRPASVDPEWFIASIMSAGAK